MFTPWYLVLWQWFSPPPPTPRALLLYYENLVCGSGLGTGRLDPFHLVRVIRARETANAAARANRALLPWRRADGTHALYEMEAPSSDRWCSWQYSAGGKV